MKVKLRKQNQLFPFFKENRKREKAAKNVQNN